MGCRQRKQWICTKYLILLLKTGRGKVIHNYNPGPKPYLNAEEDRESAGYLIEASNNGYGKTRRDVLSLVESNVEKKEDVSLRSDNITHGWWQKF